MSEQGPRSSEFAFPGDTWLTANTAGRFRILERRRLARGRRTEGRLDAEPTSVDCDTASSGIVVLDGATFGDVPGFYLAWADALRAPHGYAGACLHSLRDCFCGGFGLVAPTLVRVRNAEVAASALGGLAWARHRALKYQANLHKESGDRTVLIENGFLGDGGTVDIENWERLYDFLLENPGSDTLPTELRETGSEMVVDYWADVVATLGSLTQVRLTN